MFRKLAADVLVLSGLFWWLCSAVLAAGFPELGIGFAGVALAFGLDRSDDGLCCWSYFWCHFNPAVTIGLWLADVFRQKKSLAT